MRTRFLGRIFLAVSLCVFASITNAENFKLSQRTTEKFQEFKGLVNDANERQKVVNAILLIAPFKVLLDKPDPSSLYEIKTTDWDLIATASQGFASDTRQQLKQWCELEALSQQNSAPDFKFWVTLSKQFLPPKPLPSISGTYSGTIRDKNNKATGLVDLNFSGSGKTYSGNVIYYNLSHGNPDGSSLSSIKIEDDLRITFSVDGLVVTGSISPDGKSISGLQFLNPQNSKISLARK